MNSIQHISSFSITTAANRQVRGHDPSAAAVNQYVQVRSLTELPHVRSRAIEPMRPIATMKRLRKLPLTICGDLHPGLSCETHIFVYFLQGFRRALKVRCGASIHAHDDHHHRD